MAKSITDTFSLHNANLIWKNDGYVYHVGYMISLKTSLYKVNISYDRVSHSYLLSGK